MKIGSRQAALFFAPVCAAILAVGDMAAASERPASADVRAGLYPFDADLSARDIIARAHAASGGEVWVKPKTLKMSGYGVFYRDGAATVYDEYVMLRVFPAEKGDAHSADGKVRIEGKKAGRTVFLMAFDGSTTYDLSGPVADQTANAQWSSNFGYGAIRHALEDGWKQARLPDDFVDGRLAHFIELTDPAGGVTRFGIAADDFATLSVGFDTPRGWHERRYSEFFENPGVDWVQPGRVRLFYDGVKQNEIIWTNFEVDAPLTDEMFVVVLK